MASSPKWKVYDSHGTYQASCKEPEAASILCDWYGNGSTVGHTSRTHVVWKTGVVVGLDLDTIGGLMDSASRTDAHAFAIVRAFKSAGSEAPYTREEFKAAVARQMEP